MHPVSVQMKKTESMSYPGIRALSFYTQLPRSDHATTYTFLRSPSLAFIQMQLKLLILAAWCCFAHGSQAKGGENTDIQQPWMHEVRRAPKPYTDPSTGHTHFEKFYERTNKRTGTHTSFRSTSVLRENDFINLDTIPGVQTLTCSKEHVLRVDMHGAEDTVSLHGLISQNQLIYASLEWGCVNDDGYKAPLFLRITSEPEIGSNGMSLTLRTQPASPFAFFGRHVDISNLCMLMQHNII